MNRVEVVHHLLHALSVKTYLEIGCFRDECFSLVRVPFKIGVDPHMGGNLRMTSDEFFARWKGPPFDLVFIDGDHSHEQVLKDLDNALMVLSPHGAVVLHDCHPPNASYETSALCGSGWRAFVKRREHPNLDAMVGDFDYGVGVVFKRRNPLPITLSAPHTELSYDDLSLHRHDWLRLSPPERLMQFIVSG